MNGAGMLRFQCCPWPILSYWVILLRSNKTIGRSSSAMFWKVLPQPKGFFLSWHGHGFLVMKLRAFDIQKIKYENDWKVANFCRILVIK